MKKSLTAIIFSLIAMCLTGCGIYSFSGTSIQPDVTSITVQNFDNRAMLINPTLANDLTIALQDKYRKLTKLDMLSDGGDLVVSGFIVSYEVTPTAITSDEVASMNRLTIAVRIKFVNEKHPEDNFERNFAAYQDYDSNNSLDSVQGILCEQIIETLVEDIFNATVADWK